MDILPGSGPLGSGPTGPGSGFSVMPASNRWCGVLQRNYVLITKEEG